MHGTVWLRERQRLRVGTPVIVVTGFPDDLPASEAARLDAHGPYAKPYAFDDLATLLVTAASSRRSPVPSSVVDLIDVLDRLTDLRDGELDIGLAFRS